MATYVVSAAGDGDFRTVNEAVAAVPDHAQEDFTIRIKKGIYWEKIVVPSSKQRLSFVGESREGTVLVYTDYAGQKDADGNKLGTEHCASTFIHADDFYAENLTFSNYAGLYKGQAVALHVTGDRAVFRNVCIRGHQDTLFADGHGRQYYADCFIEGTVDFIFGSATAVFERCHIHSIRRHNGFVTAASTGEEQRYGYVFLDCKLTSSAPDGTVFLGRPWKPYAKVAYVNCWMDSHIRPEGWDNWRDPERERTARFCEINSSGPGACPDGRVPWSAQLAEPGSGEWTAAGILAGQDGWVPTADHHAEGKRDSPIR
jgi:pectinesterase